MLTMPNAGGAAFAGLTLVLVASRWNRVRGSTLVAPWAWSLAALTGMIALPFVADENWRLLGISLTLCPGIALLGAKRPQDRAWQFIVGSLWIVLALPALQSLAFQRGSHLELHPARSWFLLAIAMIGIINAATGAQHWAWRLLAGFGQLLWLLPFLPASLHENLPRIEPLLVGNVVVAMAVLGMAFSRLSRSARHAFDQAWLDFRDSFGLVWSLRFMERVNQLAQSNGWDLRLTWSGFTTTTDALDWHLAPDQLRVAEQSLRNLYRRFVSPQWLADRLA